MVSRPTSIAVISWLLIILSILGALGYLSTALQQSEPQIQEALKASPLSDGSHGAATSIDDRALRDG